MKGRTRTQYLKQLKNIKHINKKELKGNKMVDF